MGDIEELLSEDVYKRQLLSLGSMALLSIDTDDPEAAKQINEAYVREAIAFYGEAHVNTWGAVNNLGYIYDKLGDYQRALECYAWVYERIQQTGTKETLPKAVIMLDNMAQTYKRLDVYKRQLQE